MKSKSRPAAERTWFAVVGAYQTCTRRYEQLLARLDLTPAQYDALTAIQDLAEDAQPMKIAEQLLVTRGNVTGLLNRLAVRGLIRLRPHPADGRARIARLTPSGQALVERARPFARAFIEAQMEPFSRADLAMTRRLMERMQRHLEKLDPDTISPPGQAATGPVPRQARLI